MADDKVTAIGFPVETRQDLRNAFARARSLRDDPAILLCWDPEADMPLLERERQEMALALYLVSVLETGAGEIESRVRACRLIYARNVAAQADAVRAAELLFRSRILSGSTDIETFWLTAAFAHPLHAIVSPDLRRIAWDYLRHAPFNLDPQAATLFAKASKPLQRRPFPRWPMELVEWLMRRPDQADLGATILQAHLCVSLGARTPADLADKLQAGSRGLDQATQDALELLARYYVRIEADAVHARDLVAFVAQRVMNPEPYSRYLAETIFDLPYDELYDVVSARAGDIGALDALYERFVSRDRWDVARRLVEAELVRRLNPWHYGGFQPHLSRALSRIMAGADIDHPRIRTLVVRLARAHTRTRMVDSRTRPLLDHIAERPEYAEDGVPILEIRQGIGAFLDAAEPKTLLERERQLIEARKDALSLPEQCVFDEVYRWVQRRFRPRVEALRPATAVASGPASDTFSALGEKRTALGNVESHLRKLYFRTFPSTFCDRVKNEVSEGLEVPFDQVRSLDLDTVYTLARRQARRGRVQAFGLGAIAGVTNGIGGAVAEVGAVSLLAARTVVRIGAWFGIEPGTDESFEFLIDSLFGTLAVDAGGGLVAYLVDQKPVARHFLWVNLAQLLSARVRRRLRTGDAGGLSGLAATALLASSRRTLPGWRPYHWRHAIAVANAVAAGAANVQLYREFTEAALHIAARRRILERLGLVAPRNLDSEFHPAGTVPPSSVRRIW